MNYRRTCISCKYCLRVEKSPSEPDVQYWECRRWLRGCRVGIEVYHNGKYGSDFPPVCRSFKEKDPEDWHIVLPTMEAE